MPAVSQAQRTFFAICEHDPKHAKGKCPRMTQSQFHDYTKTPAKGLPYKVGDPRKAASHRGR